MTDYKRRAEELEAMIRDLAKDLKHKGDKPQDQYMGDLMLGIMMEVCLEHILEEDHEPH